MCGEERKLLVNGSHRSCSKLHSKRASPTEDLIFFRRTSRSASESFTASGDVLSLSPLADRHLQSKGHFLSALPDVSGVSCLPSSVLFPSLVAIFDGAKRMVSEPSEETNRAATIRYKLNVRWDEQKGPGSTYVEHQQLGVIQENI
jgi:hypothetical protein